MVDAAHETDGATAPIDAALDVLADGAVDPARVIRKRAARFVSEARLSPDPPTRDQTVDLAIKFTELDDTARMALAAGRLHARITVEHFAHHDIVKRATVVVDAEGSVSVTWAPRQGKHHVTIELLAKTTSLGRTRFDVDAD